MPTYEYKCPKCGAAFEKVMKITDPKEIKCDTKDCPGNPDRLISRGGFVLNGGGWYRSGYR